MDTTTWVLLAVLLVALLGLAWFVMQKRRTEELKEQFGSEYDQTVQGYGDQRRAEQELEGRRARVEQLHIHTLSGEEQGRFAEAWRAAQARFVDDPPGAIRDADRLVKEVMQARGYPVGNFEQRAADLSVNHANVVTHYRAAREIAARNEQNQADTEELRQAMVHYRALFQDLLEEQEARPRETLQ